MSSIVQYDTDIFRTESQTLLRICQAIGAAPIHLPIPLSSTTSTIITYKQWKIFLVKCVHKIWSATIFLSILTAMYSQRSHFDESGSISKITQTLYLIEYGANILIVSIIMIGCNLNGHRYVDMFRDFKELDVKLKKYGSDLVRISKYIQRLIAIIALVLLIVIVIDSLYSGALGFVAVIRSQFVYVLPNVIQFMALAEYVFILRSVRERYGRLNDGLEKIKRSSSAVEFSRIINLAREIRHDLCLIELQVNDLFGLLVVSAIASSFIICGIQLYAMYEFAKDMINMKFKENYYLVIYTLAWLSMHALKCVYLLMLNAHVNNQVSQ